MHVPSKSDDPRHRLRRGYVAAALMGLLACVGSTAGAVDFDDKLKAPRVKNVTELRGQAQSFAARFAELQAAAPESRVTNRALFRERFELTWQIQQAIDAHEPLGDLSTIGLQVAEHGAYRLNYAEAPQWFRLDQLLAGVLPQTNWEILGPQLIARGFREQDVTVLRNYVLTHDARAAARQRALPISLAFSRFVRKFDKLKLPVTDDLVLSYLYQTNKADAEAMHDWAEALLGSLDAQRGRILISYFTETASTGLWAPSDRQAGIADVLATMRLPNYEQLARDEAKGTDP